MSEPQNVTPEQMLAICNLTSTGVSLKVAKERILSPSAKTEAPVNGEKKKPSRKDRKAAMAKEIKDLGGKAPEENASVAKFEEALTTAKTYRQGGDVDDLI